MCPLSHARAAADATLASVRTATGVAIRFPPGRRQTGQALLPEAPPRRVACSNGSQAVTTATATCWASTTTASPRLHRTCAQSRPRTTPPKPSRAVVTARAATRPSARRVARARLGTLRPPAGSISGAGGRGGGAVVRRVLVDGVTAIPASRARLFAARGQARRRKAVAV